MARIRLAVQPICLRLPATFHRRFYRCPSSL